MTYMIYSPERIRLPNLHAGKEYPLASQEHAARPRGAMALPLPAALGLLTLLVLLSFGRAVLQRPPYPMVFEDRGALLGNPEVRDGRVAQAFTQALWSPDRVQDHTGTYRPLTVLSLALNRAVAGPSSFAFHLVNLVLHLLASLLLFVLLRALLEDATAALLAAGPFSRHPRAAGSRALISRRGRPS